MTLIESQVQIVTRPAPVASSLNDLPAVLRRVYAGRGVSDSVELDRSLRHLLAPGALSDIEIAAARLARAVMESESILIVGDFDADGATSVALALTLLGAMGAECVDFVVPNRFEFGYGLSPEIVELAARLHPAVLVTVDNGVSSCTGVARANALGMDVIITDHHLPGRELPDAYAIVNPNLVDCEFPSKSLAGVGVIYYLLSVTRARLRKLGWFDSRPEPNMADWLDLVALGTVADVVPLDRNNRILVYQGLKRIRGGRCRPGIQALCEIAGRNLGKLSAGDMGFALGPRLNAAGRLDDMTIGIRCLIADDLATARGLATELDELNSTRRRIEQDMVNDANLIVANHTDGVRDRFGVCVYDPNWHQGIVGIVAGRLREKIHRPVVAFAEAGDLAPDELKGSARSLPELHIRDVFDAIATRYPGMLQKFGGHAMAAGLSIKRVHYERFAKAFDEQVREVLPPVALQPTITTDGALEDGDFTLDVARLLNDAGPWGQGFPEPQFYGEFDLVSQRVVGEHHLKLVLKLGDRLFDAIAFRQAPLIDAKLIRAVYRLSENDYRDLSTLQLVVEHVAALA
ncbi:MAG: single-stranded-DNA-specific exonuclease RecJ [Gammaproteobacteria bacterium]|nr:single-stranded-DNA-specific exonuclease RecJ [Gammaproteobacteria bacterium]